MLRLNPKYSFVDIYFFLFFFNYWYLPRSLDIERCDHRVESDCNKLCQWCIFHQFPHHSDEIILPLALNQLSAFCSSSSASSTSTFVNGKYARLLGYGSLFLMVLLWICSWQIDCRKQNCLNSFTQQEECLLPMSVSLTRSSPVYRRLGIGMLQNPTWKRTLSNSKGPP